MRQASADYATVRENDFHLRAPHDQRHLGRDGLAEGYQEHPGATSPAARVLAALP
jgi:hypothetical protein